MYTPVVSIAASMERRRFMLHMVLCVMEVISAIPVNVAKITSLHDANHLAKIMLVSTFLSKSQCLKEPFKKDVTA